MGCRRSDYAYDYNRSSHQDKMAMGVAITCFVVVIGAACFVAGLYLQKQRQLR